MSVGQKNICGAKKYVGPEQIPRFAITFSTWRVASKVKLHCQEVIQYNVTPIGSIHPIRVLQKISRFMIILWDSSISKTVFGGPLWGSWGGWNPLGEPPEGVIFKVLLLIIRIPYFFEIWAKICQNLTKKNFNIFFT